MASRTLWRLDDLNLAWWNAFWGHRYSDWEQIHPHEIFHDGLSLDWKRFVTDLTVDFMLHEKASVLAHSQLPVTTNMMGHFPLLDYWRFAPHLDIISNDAYPSFHGRSDETLELAGAAFEADLMRCLGGGKPWLLMESTPSQLNWTENFIMKRPGVHRREMQLQIGAGADGTCYFQWRKGRGGSEKYHGAVVDHAGVDTRVFAEIAEHGQALKSLQPVLGCGVPAEAAILEDWQMRWGLEVAHGPRRTPKDKGYIEEVRAWHAALTTRGVSCDLIEANSDFSDYKLLLLPMAYQVSPELGQRLADFVAAGGILCMSYLSAHMHVLSFCPY